MSSVGGADRRARGLLSYGFLLLGTVLAFLVIQQLGSKLTAPAAAEGVTRLAGRQAPEVDVVYHVLISLSAIIGLGNLLAVGCRRFGQPAVIGEMIAGILLGPSFLGAASPAAMHALIPDVQTDPHGLVLSSLKTISQIGVVLYMFIVGLDLNTHKVHRHAYAAVAISHASIVFPFVLGAALALWLYPMLSSSDVEFTSFALFLGVAMSITAFPVLARILADRGLEQTEMGVIALSCAAADDVTAWCLLAFVVGVTKAQLQGAATVVMASAAFITVMFLIIRPVIWRWMARAEQHGIQSQAIPALLIAVLCAALSTEAIGIHTVFGAFLLGAVIPHDSRIAQELSNKIRDVVTILLLPAFFAVTGINTRIGLINGLQNWLVCLAIIAVATLGKFGGTLIASRFAGLDWRTSGALGVLMNTRGLMELIVLNIGLSLGVISPQLFTMMVLMALATTMATAPILRTLLPVAKGAATA